MSAEQPCTYQLDCEGLQPGEGRMAPVIGRAEQRLHVRCARQRDALHVRPSLSSRLEEAWLGRLTGRVLVEQRRDMFVDGEAQRLAAQPQRPLAGRIEVAPDFGEDEGLIQEEGEARTAGSFLVEGHGCESS